MKDKASPNGSDCYYPNEGFRAIFAVDIGP